MKNINVKKIVAGAAALGVGALMISGAMAANVTPADWTQVKKEDLFNNGVPAVSIVVGNNAQPIDVVWAGNIAAAIGKNAHTVIEGSEGGYLFNNVVVEVGTEGTSVISGDGELFDDYEIGTTSGNETVDLDADNYSLLQEIDADADVDGTDLAVADELTIEDTFAITNPLISFDNDDEIAEITLAIEKETMTYTVDLDEGLYDSYDDSDASPALKVPFMGKDYVVDSWDGDKLTLVESVSTQAYAEGTVFDVGDYTVEVTTILDKGDETGYEVELTLKDAEGTTVSTEVYGNDEDVFEDYLVDSIETDTIYASRVSFVIGASGKVELENGDLDDFPTSGDEFWNVTLDKDESGTLTAFSLTNTNDFEFVDEDALMIGDSIELPNDFGFVEFLGLTVEETEEFTVSDNTIEYVDASDEDHSIFVYEQDDTTSTFSEYTTDGEVDGDNIYFSFAVNADPDVNYTVDVHYNDEDGDALFSNLDMNEGWNAITIATDDTDADINYGVYLSGDYNTTLPNQFAMGLATNDEYSVYGNDSKDWKISNTAADYVLLDGSNSDGTLAAEYVGQLVLNASVDGTDDVVTEELEATYKLVLNDSVDDISAVFDVYDGDLIDTESDDWESGNFQVYSDNADLGVHDSDDLTEAYTDYGTEYMIDSGAFTAVIPESRLLGQVFVGGGTSTDVELNGATLTLTEEGMLVSSEDETISAKLVSKSIDGTGSSEAAIVPAVWNPANLVILDTQFSANPKVIVGGYLVNALAEGIGLEDVITTSTDYVVGKNATGNIVVAGMDAADTEAAARELIAAIEAM